MVGGGGSKHWACISQCLIEGAGLLERITGAVRNEAGEAFLCGLALVDLHALGASTFCAFLSVGLVVVASVTNSEW